MKRSKLFAGVVAAALTLAEMLAIAPEGAAARRGRQYVIECSSKKGNYNYCRTYSIGSVRLVQQLSKARCRLYDTWGPDPDGNGLWVREGCRGLFAVERAGGKRRPLPPGVPTSVTCKSDDWSYRHCDVPTWGRRIYVQKRLSRTPCVRGDNWGLDWGGIWVDRGCAAVFGVD
jgi:hypothetical protein